MDEIEEWGIASVEAGRQHRPAESYVVGRHRYYGYGVHVRRSCDRRHREFFRVGNSHAYTVLGYDSVSQRLRRVKDLSDVHMSELVDEALAGCVECRPVISVVVVPLKPVHDGQVSTIKFGLVENIPGYGCVVGIHRDDIGLVHALRDTHSLDVVY